MSNIYVLAANTLQGDYSVAVHIVIPSVNNLVGVNYQTALINSGIGGRTILPTGDGTKGTISAADLASIQAGSLYEVTTTFRPTGGNLAAIQASLLASAEALQTSALAQLQAQLQYFGYTA